MKWERDKKVHAIAGFLISLSVGTAFIVQTDAPIVACVLIGALVGCIVGWAKEYLYDAKHPDEHTVDADDWAATTLGAIAGAPALLIVNYLIAGCWTCL